MVLFQQIKQDTVGRGSSFALEFIATIPGLNYIVAHHINADFII
jgi:hypothetical protein